jgi:hypothetical protein
VASTRRVQRCRHRVSGALVWARAHGCETYRRRHGDAMARDDKESELPELSRIAVRGIAVPDMVVLMLA